MAFWHMNCLSIFAISKDIPNAIVTLYENVNRRSQQINWLPQQPTDWWGAWVFEWGPDDLTNCLSTGRLIAYEYIIRRTMELTSILKFYNLHTKHPSKHWLLNTSDMEICLGTSACNFSTSKDELLVRKKHHPVLILTFCITTCLEAQ